MLTQTIRIGVGVRGVLFGSFLDKQKGTIIKGKISNLGAVCLKICLSQSDMNQHLFKGLLAMKNDQEKKVLRLRLQALQTLMTKIQTQIL